MANLTNTASIQQAKCLASYSAILKPYNSNILSKDFDVCDTWAYQATAGCGLKMQIEVLMKTVLIACLASFGYVLYLYGMQSLKIEMAREQIAIFALMRSKSAEGSCDQALEYLSYVRNYYPSGTRQTKGSSLDEIVETSRNAALRDISSYIEQPTASTINEPTRQPITRDVPAYSKK